MDEAASQGLRVAVEGCGHGTLDGIYESASKTASEKGWDGLDLVIIGGDFQANRNQNDLNVMACPVKYRSIMDFHKYYSGEATAPYLTIFIGGNHESSPHLFELYYGGWVAPNIYYLGAANVVRIGPLRIAGMSGIWKGFDYPKPHYERLPYNDSDIRSIYHTREIDVRKLLQLRTQVDIGLSHDWPQGAEWAGDHRKLFRRKPYLQEEAQNGRLNNKAARWVCQHLRPHYWFSAHHHIEYSAVLHHEPQTAQALGQGSPPAKRMKVSHHESRMEDGVDFGADFSSQYGNTDALNADEINLDSDSENDDTKAELPPAATPNPDEIDLDTDDEAGKSQDKAPSASAHGVETRANKEEAEGENEANAKEAADALAAAKARLLANLSQDRRVDQASAPREVQFFDGGSIYAPSSDLRYPPYRHRSTPTNAEVGITAEERALLPASFGANEEPSEDFPEPHFDIANETTNFLALGKFGPHGDFLRVLNLTSLSSESKPRQQGQYRLEYDPEWLAITRVFADIKLGDRSARNPPDQGRGAYRAQIEQEESWVEKHVVKPGKLAVPLNFTQVAPTYDASVGSGAQPREYPSPQTQAFCDLIGIENAFAMTDEEAERRRDAGPEPVPQDVQDRIDAAKQRRRGGFDGRGRGRGRGGGAGRGRGGFRGRGRGGHHRH